MAQNSYHMIYEGFWDLYCKKPATTDLTSKKLEGWINNIVLKVSSAPAVEEPQPVNLEEGAEGEPVAEAPPVPEPAQPEPSNVKAVVRVRIPFKRPEAEEGEEEEDKKPQIDIPL